MKNQTLIFIVLVFFGSFFTTKAQSAIELNNYKYVVIPMQFSFQDSENEFLLNSRVKHLFDEQNFNTVMKDHKYPSDLAFNQCLALYANVKSESEGFFSMITKLRIVLKNCRNEVVFQSKIGESRTKDVGEAYKEALRDAFLSFTDVYYNYNGGKGYVDSEDQEPEDTPKMSIKPKNPLQNTADKIYMLNGKSFVVYKIEAGYLLKNTETGERVALLNLTENNSILYNSDNINGTATIGQNGNITVEYFDRTAGKLEKVVYQKKEGQ